MTKAWLARSARALAVAGIFGAGVVTGSVLQRPAAAQLGELGGKAMEKAAEGGGTLGSAGKLGTAIMDMQKEVDGLQKNLETLKTIKSALGG